MLRQHSYHQGRCATVEGPMCLAIPGRVIELLDGGGHFATVDVSGVRRRVNIDLLREDGLAVGDWVLIHVGFAMSVIGDAEAREQLRVLQLLGEAGDALEEFRGYRFGDDAPAAGGTA